jgi:hypothetical protein
MTYTWQQFVAFLKERGIDATTFGTSAYVRVEMDGPDGIVCALFRRATGRFDFGYTEHSEDAIRTLRGVVAKLRLAETEPANA